MRSLLVLGLIFFHTARIFDFLPYYVKNSETSIVAMAFVGFVSQWGMPLLFFLAGVTVWHSLDHRTPGQFVKERLRRLIIPFLFGLCVIVPPARYYSLMTDPGYDESYWQFYPKFFRVVFEFGFPRFIRPDPEIGLFDPAHLWFLYYLFAFSVVALPLFAYLKRAGGRRLIQRLAELCERRGAILLLAIPVVLIELFVNLGESVGWNRYAFLSFLVFGYSFASSDRFEQAASRDARLFLLAGTLAVAAFLGASMLVRQSGVDPSTGYDAESVLWRLFKACSSWFWVMAIWGLAERCRKRQATRAEESDSKSSPGRAGKILRYSNDAVLPFYILHEPLIVIIGFYVVKWETLALIKYLVISVTAATITIILYQALIRRVNILRFLFGMRRRSQTEA